MKYNELISNLKKKIKLTQYGQVKEQKLYKLYKIIINNKSNKTLIITAGFHGEEFNGPISLLGILEDIIKYSRKKKVNLIIYPCINPSGFDLRKRYNASDEKLSNDLMHYEIKRGVWKGIIRQNEKFLRFKIITPNTKEAKELLKDLMKQKVPAAYLDIHQDDELPQCDFYAYPYGSMSIYRKIMKKLDKFSIRCRNVKPLMFDEKGLEFNDTIDNEGFILTSDGTLNDLYFRLGTKYSLTAETWTKTPLETVERINKTWILGLIDFVSKGKQLDLKRLQSYK